MNILILMAGAGSRFEQVGYPLPKPLIEVNDKHIIEWTTRSLPFIDHYNSQSKQKIIFAIRQKDEDNFQITKRLTKIYGKKIDFKVFDNLTKGNLETAFLSLNKFSNIHHKEDLLILDSDNHYDGSNLINFINILKLKHSLFSAICDFDPIDNSAKWCFAIKNGDRVNKLVEKDNQALLQGGKPMVGVFYFSQIQLFKRIAEYILNQKIEYEKEKKEIYMSQSVQKCIDLNIPVYGLNVKNVIPLGTPEDIVNLKDKEFIKFSK
jgi:NDP-sugar pyrophosphorylase family protein